MITRDQLIESVTGKKNIQEAEQDKWGFDLTHFETSENFKKILKALGISDKPKEEGSSNKKFTWTGKGIKLVTAANPITGFFRKGDIRPGYASYVGIEGDADKVKKAVALVKKYSGSKDESPHARDFI